MRYQSLPFPQTITCREIKKEKNTGLPLPRAEGRKRRKEKKYKHSGMEIERKAMAQYVFSSITFLGGLKLRLGNTWIIQPSLRQ